MEEKITYSEVLDTSNTLKNTANKMREICDEVSSQMTKLQGQWQSASADEFITKFNALKAKFPSFYEAVQAYSTFLDKTVQTYQDADAAIAGNADGLAN